jgi:hypothetical protein
MEPAATFTQRLLERDAIGRPRETISTPMTCFGDTR